MCVVIRERFFAALRLKIGELWHLVIINYSFEEERS
jgi:hypothetical protein